MAKTPLMFRILVEKVGTKAMQFSRDGTNWSTSVRGLTDKDVNAVIERLKLAGNPVRDTVNE